MYVIIKHVVGMAPVVEVALTKEEAIFQAERFISDIAHFEGETHPDALPTPKGEPKQGFWDSGSFVVARKKELRI